MNQKAPGKAGAWPVGKNHLDTGGISIKPADGMEKMNMIWPAGRP